MSFVDSMLVNIYLALSPRGMQLSFMFLLSMAVLLVLRFFFMLSAFQIYLRHFTIFLSLLAT